MERNIGAADAYIRILLGTSFLLNIFQLETGALGTIVLLVLSALSFYTAYTGYCALYKVLGISTIPSPAGISTGEPSGSESGEEHA